MRESIFLDTSAIYALINRKDPDHNKAKGFLDGFKGKAFITNYIFTETMSLVNARLGHERAIIAGETLLKSSYIERVWVTPADEKEAWSLFVSRDDKSYSFTDCTSFVVMKRLKIKRCLTFDEHFKQEGFEGVIK